MVHRMQAEADPVPTTIREAWHAAGPERAVGELAQRLARCDRDGHLTVADPHLGARHYLSLTVGAILQRPSDPALDPPSTTGLIQAGVAVFLRGYEPR